MHHEYRQIGGKLKYEIAVRYAVHTVETYSVETESLGFIMSVGSISGTGKGTAADGGNVHAAAAV